MDIIIVLVHQPCLCTGPAEAALTELPILVLQIPYPEIGNKIGIFAHLIRIIQRCGVSDDGSKAGFDGLGGVSQPK